MVPGSGVQPLALISKRDFAVVPNLGDYAEECRTFTWERARNLLHGLPGGGLNIAYEAVDCHVAAGRGNRVAIRWLGKAGATREISYGELKQETDRFAQALRELGIQRGEVVCGLTGRIPDLYIAALGTLKAGAVFSPLFAAFGPEPIQQRMELGAAAALVTTPALYRRKVASIRARLPALRQVILVGEDVPQPPAGTVVWTDVAARTAASSEIAATAADERALLHFTSGTTGRPKGAIHVHEAVVAHYVTAFYALDLHQKDVFWCTADPGWVTGMSYGIIAPLTHGITVVVDEAEFDPVHWYHVLRDEKVSVWYTAPTAVRMLMRAGLDLAHNVALPALRFIASVGEPLNPEAVTWGLQAFGLPIHDNWWQTETGGIMISNFASMDIRPGSMGKPLPGVEAAVVDKTKHRVRVLGAGEEGELAIRAGWPSMFRGYLNDEARYRECFRGGWYLTGDLVRRDDDGYYWFVGRADDVIKSAGHLIGPFEVESALMCHPAVAEAAVIGKPDPMVGATVKAFVSLKPGFEATDELLLELLGFGRQRLGAAVAPKEIAFMPDIPRTRSGKIMRRLLRARELGLPEGDLSTLEGPGSDS